MVIPLNLPDDAPVILGLHGSLGNGEESFGCFYEENGLPPCVWLFPDGPLLVRQKSRRTMVIRHAWYDRFTHSYADMKKSREWLTALLDHYTKQGLDENGNEKVLAKPRPVIILGQSQGGVMAFETGMNYSGDLRAIVSVCGFIEYPEKTLFHPLPVKNTAILMLNGKMDPVVQNEDALATLRELKRKGYRPSLRFYEVGHEFTAGMRGSLEFSTRNARWRV